MIRVRRSALGTVGSWILINEADGEAHFGQPITPFDLNVTYSSADTISWFREHPTPGWPRSSEEPSARRT